MRTLVIAMPIIALLSGCFFGPSGNALGLEGEYVGTIKSDISGATTYYQGGQTTNVTVEGISDSPGNISVEKGYGDVDAFLSGLGCPALLVVSGAQHVLMEDAECTTENDISSTARASRALRAAGGPCRRRSPAGGPGRTARCGAPPR